MSNLNIMQCRKIQYNNLCYILKVYIKGAYNLINKFYKSIIKININNWNILKT